jgi:hypothetical protein
MLCLLFLLHMSNKQPLNAAQVTEAELLLGLVIPIDNANRSNAPSITSQSETISVSVAAPAVAPVAVTRQRHVSNEEDYELRVKPCGSWKIGAATYWSQPYTSNNSAAYNADDQYESGSDCDDVDSDVDSDVDIDDNNGDNHVVDRHRIGSNSSTLSDLMRAAQQFSDATTDDATTTAADTTGSSSDSDDRYGSEFTASGASGAVKRSSQRRRQQSQQSQSQQSQQSQQQQQRRATATATPTIPTVTSRSGRTITFTEKGAASFKTSSRRNTTAAAAAAAASDTAEPVVAGAKRTRGSGSIALSSRKQARLYDDQHQLQHQLQRGGVVAKCSKRKPESAAMAGSGKRLKTLHEQQSGKLHTNQLQIHQLARLATADYIQFFLSMPHSCSMSRLTASFLCYRAQ